MVFFTVWLFLCSHYLRIIFLRPLLPLARKHMSSENLSEAFIFTSTHQLLVQAAGFAIVRVLLAERIDTARG